MCVAVAAVAVGCGSSSKKSSSTSTANPTASSKQFSPAVQAKLRQAVQSYVGTGKFPGLVVGISSPEGSFLYAAGSSNLGTHAPLQVNQVFRIGSITKTFTATVILQLAQQGKLSLSDPLSKYEPQIPNASSITIRELLNMTSGIRHGSSPTPNAQNPQSSLSPQQVIANTTRHPLLFTPGTKYSYSDTGYLILGEVATKVTGTDIGTLIQHQILTPLGLHHTVYDPIRWRDGFHGRRPGDMGSGAGHREGSPEREHAAAASADGQHGPRDQLWAGDRADHRLLRP
jgi:D-alanyl-D-alanine carboxypeptidase